MTSALDLITGPARRLLGLTGRLKRDRRGSILVEFAISIPILTIIVFGSLETARYVLLRQKLDRAASTMADLITRTPSIDQAQIDDAFEATRSLLVPFDLALDGRVIVTSVEVPIGETTPVVAWQVDDGGGLSATSEVGATGATAQLPSGFNMREAENVIITEVYYRFQPWILPQLFPTEVVRHDAYRRPRLGVLNVIAPPS